MIHGFVKVAAATPRVSVADCKANLREMRRIFDDACERGVKILVYPELCITGYTCADLFYSDVLLTSARDALIKFAKSTSDSDMISIVGLPLVVNDKIYNSAAICQKGQILGVIPKSYIPNYAEFGELRHFSAAPSATEDINIGETSVPFGTKLIFACRELPELKLAVEICEDLWVSIPPSCYHTAAGATVIANLSASDETVAKDDYRRLLVKAQSAKCSCAYIYADCGEGESTTDLVFGGNSIIAENGTVLDEREPFDYARGELICTEIDVCRLSLERRRVNTYTVDNSGYRKIEFSMDIVDTELTRAVDPHPFIPADDAERERRCGHILAIQAHGLSQRIQRAYADKCVIGISGGLDSCLAILVAAEALDLIGRPRTDILGVTMPCFGTTGRTRSNAEILCAALGAEMICVDIGASVRQHFTDIGHDESMTDVVYENAQARERTQVLMDVANARNGIVVGTGDLSELALGWATYNGDHMSMYGVNASVPKTLVRYLVAWYAERAEREGRGELCAVLRDILDTPVSPELLPADENGEIAQRTEDIVGPYEIHDFYLYNMIRFGFAPDKLYRLAKIAFAGDYSDEVLLKWLKNFVRRFFAQQFKRSCLPDGPKVGSVSFSPRGDWRMPSDASREEWMRIVDSLE
ncbi:MAG: NAD(+) synthase [Clostridia bacterium]|nr:NAD(+) synthase [Clostridia bacterium]